ncbi:MAG: amidohydrolase family protein [Lentisphaerae bacterium]|nr:amidohydrolase family protein [Lentisphaerota bacterium]MBT4822352.1 amidohydrolase family protein [Lentisphaerota bacterium]MBT5612945.1 amidohydrolase family protein [Lentisphaerota bacterium]MBT7053602.1 amidohydrolase family protein [Lentisphaerota bacterium]MBT7843142.1 amidohydrolase family protein [Lentisphaerota bacterium]
MIIDCHSHLTGAAYSAVARKLNKTPFTAASLLRRMDIDGIDRSVLLPIGNPENHEVLGIATNLECLQAYRKHPDRLIPFCNIDPRMMYNTPEADLSELMNIYRDMGCRGIGEACAGLSIVDPRYRNLFHHAGQCGMPVLFHLTGKRRGTYGMIDRLHLPGLETVLGEFPDTVFIGHAMAFWGEIDGDLRLADREDYPEALIRKEGRLWTLLKQYPNLYGDLSAGSGYNAISRDPETGYRFLQTFNRKLFYGTDRFLSPKDPPPAILTFLKDARRTGRITRRAYENIMFRNVSRVVLKGE